MQTTLIIIIFYLLAESRFYFHLVFDVARRIYIHVTKRFIRVTVIWKLMSFVVYLRERNHSLFEDHWRWIR